MKQLRFTVCRGPECGRTSADITRALRERLAALGATNVSLEHWSCFGRCRVGPNILVSDADAGPRRPLGIGLATVPGAAGGTMYNHMTPEAALRLLHRRLSGD